MEQPASSNNSTSSTMSPSNPILHYFLAIEKLIEEWDKHFKGADINMYLYDDDEDKVYSMMDKFHTRVRMCRGELPSEIKVKDLPSLRTLERNYMFDDSDLHLSDYEISIYYPLKKVLSMKDQYISVSDLP